MEGSALCKVMSIFVNMLKVCVELFFSCQKLRRNKILILDEIPYSGSNSYAFYRFLKENHMNVDVELLQYDEGRKIKNYLNRMRKIKSSQIVIASQGVPFLLKRKNQFFIQLWHGIPIKAMGLLDKSLGQSLKKYLVNLWNKTTDSIVAPSQMYSTLINSCYGIYKNYCYVITGFPRNDYLFFSGKLELLLSKLGKRLCSVKNVVLCVPTFRKGCYSRVEGIERNRNFFGFEKFDLEDFDNFLKAKNILFIAKLHPYEEKFYKEIYKGVNLENFLFLTSELLKENDIDLYEILPDVVTSI